MYVCGVIRWSRESSGTRRSVWVGVDYMTDRLKPVGRNVGKCFRVFDVGKAASGGVRLESSISRYK